METQFIDWSEPRSIQRSKRRFITVSNVFFMIFGYFSMNEKTKCFYWNFICILYRADYIAWNGANSELCKGNRSHAKGADPSLRSNRLNITQGSKSELCKGPQAGLAKGSIFTQLKMQQIANVKCN